MRIYFYKYQSGEVFMGDKLLEEIKDGSPELGRAKGSTYEGYLDLDLKKD